MPQLQIQVTNKKATYLERGGDIVCGNGDYSVLFSFDTEWDGVPDKVARFVWNGQYFDSPIDENGVALVPVIRGAAYVLVGVYSETLFTTTSASIPCSPSILCVSDQPDPGHGQSYSEQAKAAAAQADEAAQRAEDAAQRVEGASVSLEGIDTKLQEIDDKQQQTTEELQQLAEQHQQTAQELQTLSEEAAAALQGITEQQQQTAQGLQEITEQHQQTAEAQQQTAQGLQQLSANAAQALTQVNAKLQETDGKLGEIEEQLGQAEPVPTAIDLTALETEGKIVETYANGSTKTSVMEFDADGNPTKITDGDGNVTTLTW